MNDLKNSTDSIRPNPLHQLHRGMLDAYLQAIASPRIRSATFHAAAA